MSLERSTEADSSPRGRAGTLWIVATPIGNLADVSERARDVLRRVDVLLAEDTRHTQQLLQACGIERAPGTLWSFHEHNERGRIEEVLSRLQTGQSVAIVSDAGTPLLSDPGAPLVAAAVTAGLAVSAVPGPCAAIVALTLAGLPVDRFCFEGFLPARGPARRRVLESLLREPRTLVFYEAPHRIAETLEDCTALLGATRRAAIARELTKKFETVYRGTLAELSARATRDADMARGEIVLLVEGRQEEPAANDVGVEAERVLRALLEELPVAQAARLAAKMTGANRRQLYDRAVELRGGAAHEPDAAGEPD
jgi:16S rRNA (cytidine1402-2'-O)-methyltransferase